MTSRVSQTPIRPVSDGGLPELYFPAGLPGFPDSRRFALASWGGQDGPYSVLADLDDPAVRFLVAPPGLLFSDYEVELDDVTVDRLRIADTDEVLLLVIVTLGGAVTDATANLLGPIVINVRTREGAQAVLADSGHAARVRLAA